MNRFPIRHFCAIGLTSFGGLLCEPVVGADLFGRSRQIVCNSGSTRHDGYRTGRVLASGVLVASSSTTPAAGGAAISETQVVQPVSRTGNRHFFPNRLQLEVDGIKLERVGLNLTEDQFLRGQARIVYTGGDEQVAARVTIYGLAADQDSTEIITDNRIVLWQMSQDVNLRRGEPAHYMSLVPVKSSRHAGYEGVYIGELAASITHFEVVVERVTH